MKMGDIDREIEELENLKTQQEMQGYVDKHGIAVKFHCKNCGKKFKERLYPTQKTISLKGKTREEIEKELKPKVQCPKCKSHDVEEI
jgi:Zn finger protein HypA/HybF involved in hydrogenase expression